MNNSKTNAPPLQWHPAFYAGLQIELAEERNQLILENEHQLGTKPKEIDILIIKKNKEQTIQKNIGKIFRMHNLIEYKSPDDYLSIDDFYKVYGYACFYKSDTDKINRIPYNEITVTFVSKNYPLKLGNHLQIEHGCKITKPDAGIYYLDGFWFPMQFIIYSELDSKNNLWLRGLTNDLNDPQLTQKLISEYTEHKNENLYESVMDIIVRSNAERFKEENKMCQALDDLLRDIFKDEMIEKEKKGHLQGVADGEQRVNRLICLLLDQSRQQDIERAVRDSEYQQSLFVEFGI